MTVTLVQGQPVYSIALESQLREEIFTNYSALQRPAKIVNVKVDLTLLTVNDLVSFQAQTHVHRQTWEDLVFRKKMMIYCL